MTVSRTMAPSFFAQPLRNQLAGFLDDHRESLRNCLDGMTEAQARRSLVSSRTTLLGLVKHATFVERVWFDEAISCRSRAEIGIPETPDESFVLEESDTIASIRTAYDQACDASRTAAADLDLDDLVHGNRRGPLPTRWVYLHVLRELAQHCGHADILREQILSTELADDQPDQPIGEGVATIPLGGNVVGDADG
ncbi:DinB family protein [Nocardia sp. NPDC058480]|uniref:DinB family protein n=1 Tax=unclassified Nocardia TaxID=2637762 RepID=UPI003667D45F